MAGKISPCKTPSEFILGHPLNLTSRGKIDRLHERSRLMPSAQMATSPDSVNLGSVKYFDVIGSMFVAIYLMSQVTSAKLFTVGPFTFPGAIVIFPLSYLAGDVLTEVYGYARTRRVIWIGFIAAVLMAVVLLIVQYLPPASDWPFQRSYEQILGVVPRIVIGSIAAYWAGEFANSFAMAKMKVWTNGKMLWSRTIGSTVIGQAIDSIVFATIAFAGTVPIKILISIVGSIYLFKVLYEAAATPLTYLVVNSLKRAEGVDVYDRNTNFSPFRF
jgi:queuosine precursor transporter